LNGVRVVSPTEAAADASSLGTEGDGTVDLLIDCCGVAAAVQPALKWIKRGGTLLVFACASPTQNIR
jgi:threonine dehydrogenase-like Zn-dependent dehydrogenase